MKKVNYTIILDLRRKYPEMKMSQIAEKLGCTTKEIAKVIREHFKKVGPSHK